jgi:hypothetical protein
VLRIPCAKSATVTVYGRTGLETALLSSCELPGCKVGGEHVRLQVIVKKKIFENTDMEILRNMAFRLNKNCQEKKSMTTSDYNLIERVLSCLCSSDAMPLTLPSVPNGARQSLAKG